MLFSWYGMRRRKLCALGNFKILEALENSLNYPYKIALEKSECANF